MTQFLRPTPSFPPAGPKRRMVRPVPLAAAALTPLLVLGIMRTGDALPRSGSARAQGHGMNILLVGTDGRDTITRQEKEKFRLGGVACDCTDTMMLIHISANRKRAGLVSIPRDSLAQLSPHEDRRTGERHGRHPSKINGAYAEGGADLSMRTVEEMTGVKIDRFLGVDFSRFMKTVDTVGGVDICTARPLRDPVTGLDLSPGTHRLKGGESLQYARARKVDNSADFGRIQRQQRFVVAFIKKLRADGTMRDPVRLAKLADVLLAGPRTEKSVTLPDLVSLAKDMHDIKLSSLEFASVPIRDFNADIEGVGSTLAWDEAKADAVFATMRKDRPLSSAKSALPSRPRPTTARQGEFVPVKGSRIGCG
ncbi:LCP family protein [Streptomyces sp. BE308]|uniref:LCP family protein n=1 Tax=Streptomyces sp. BE308 TaxID=3002529 RepID=UPI002E783560|nr:LCP family protein [Streptomyces sp. BE308]MEE1796866.1 LCP family protein [Streptomyces sp. BE308]